MTTNTTASAADGDSPPRNGDGDANNKTSQLVHYKTGPMGEGTVDPTTSYDGIETTISPPFVDSYTVQQIDDDMPRPPAATVPQNPAEGDMPVEDTPPEATKITTPTPTNKTSKVLVILSNIYLSLHYYNGF
jgi:hypothetical protein